MIKLIYSNIGKIYRKTNAFLSVIFLNKFQIEHFNLKKHNKLFLSIKKNEKKVNNTKISKKDVFDSFAIFKKNIRSIIFDSDKLKKFLSEDEIHKVMFGLNRLLFLKELFLVKNDNKWSSTWSKIIKEERIGNPIPFFLYPVSSGNRIHEVYNIMKLTHFNNSQNKIENVIEFGGGYGGFCNLYKKIFKVKKYIIYDLLEVTYIQFYYLKMLGYDVSINSSKINSRNHVYLFNDQKKLNYFLNKISFKRTMFISNWGLSETPTHLRKKFEKYIKKTNVAYLAFQENFGKVNNLKYFNKIFSERKNKLNRYSRLGENHYYLFSENKYKKG